MISAEEFVGRLNELDPAAWRLAALAAAAHPGLELAVAALEQALPAADRARLWDLEDEMECALYRLTTHEAAGVVHGTREFQRIRAATWRAAGALACGALPDEARQVLAGPFLAIIAPGSPSGPPAASLPLRPRA